MRESTSFLKSLEHDNPHRPRFTIKPAEVNTMLEIQFLGQRMEVPISEVLSFAARWQADHDAQIAQDPSPRLLNYPYPLYSVRPDDPDMPEWS